MKTYRYEENPLITPAGVKPYLPGYEVIGAFNAGIAEYDGEIIMLLRVAERPISQDENIVYAPVLNTHRQVVETIPIVKDEHYDFSDPRVIRVTGSDSFSYLTSISYLRIARSKDGGHHFTVDDNPFIFPETEYETFGIEDSRITKIGDTYHIVFSSVSPVGVGVGLATTKDFQSVVRHGIILAPENKDVVLFPEQIGGKYFALHRPVPKGIGHPEVWIAESDNLRYWGNHKYLFGLRPGHWDDTRIGAGAIPIRTAKGWLELYHAADQHDSYCLGAVLLDIDDPSRVIARCEKPILEPTAQYELEGFFGSVVFSCGAVVTGDIVKVFYGVSDTSMACAELSLTEILANLQ